MAVDYCGYACGLGLEVEAGEIVEQVDGCAFGFDEVGFGQGAGPGLGVDVAADCGDRGNLFEGGEDFGAPTSPAWRMRSAPGRAARASGRSRPWVSEMRPRSIGTSLFQCLGIAHCLGSFCRGALRSVTNLVHGENALGRYRRWK